jgi:hypothetical protein
MVCHGQRRRDSMGVLPLLAGLLLSAGLPAIARTVSLEPVMTNNPLRADLRPWCIGHLVMGRPARIEMFSEGYEFWGDKIDIASNASHS